MLPPRLHKNIKAQFEDIAELRDKIRSAEMYTNPTLFNLFCRKPASIGRYMTIAHETNFRLKLWFALGKKSLRHETYPSWLKVRAKNFMEFHHLVHDDRQKHLADAWKTRKEALINTEEEGKQESEDDDDSVDGVDIDSSLLA